MKPIERKSPVSFSARALATENQDYWRVVTEYEGEGDGPWLIDLSRSTKWDVQSRALDEIRPCDAQIPENPGETAITGGMVINRMNRTQASVWHVSGDAPEAADSPAFTDVTESTLLLAVIGKDVFSITEKLTKLDMADPKKAAPYLVQGPFSHVPCQMTVAGKNGADGALLLTCSRGYGHDMVHAILDAGDEFGLRPAGTGKFEAWLNSVNTD